MKRFVTLLVAAVLLMAFAVPALAEDKTTVTFALWDENQKPVFDEIIAKFQEHNPNISVEVQLTPWSQYWTKLDAAMGAEKAADVFWMNTYLPKYAAARVLEPLDAYIAKDKLDMEAYVAVVRDAYIIDGATYALPKGMDTVQVFFNKAIFEKHGVELPKEGWTWDDMVTLATQLKEKTTVGEYPIVMELDPQPSYFNFIPQDGGFIINEDGTKAGFDQPGTINSYKKVLKLMEDGVMPDYKVLSDTKGTDLFLSQKAAILFMGSWKAMLLDEASFAKDIGLIPMPAMDASNVSVLGGLGFAMNAKAQNKDAAWELIKYLAGEESNKMQAEGKIDMPALISAQQYYAPNFKNLDASVFFKVAETGYFFPTSQKVAEWLPVVMDVSSQILSGSVSPEDGCQMIQEQMQPILDSEQK
jgi:multiple sugar transport system substrate-binding protein